MKITNETLHSRLMDQYNDEFYKRSKARFNALPIDYDRLPDFA